MKRNWFARHPIGFMALYFLLYLSAFNFLETQISMPRVLLVHCRLDDLIPFCKYAILPYFAWFAWIPFTLFTCCGRPRGRTSGGCACRCLPA